MPLTLYYHPISQPTRAVLAFLKLTGIPYELKMVEIQTGEQKKPEYLAVNPLGLVPAIDDDGFKLGESDAIVRYLMNTRKVGDEYYPVDPKKRALVDRYMAFHHATGRPSLTTYAAACLSEIIGIKISKEETRPKAEDCCKKLEEIFLKDTKYVAGDEITIADFFAVNELTHVLYLADFDFTKYPKVDEYIKRCLENPVLTEVNEPVKALPEQIKLMLNAKKEQPSS